MLIDEASLARECLKHRYCVDNWDGMTWTKRRAPYGITKTICRLLNEMDGGSMWVSDLLNVACDADIAIVRMVQLGIVEEVRFEVGKGKLLCADTDNARAFIANYDNGQGWLW